MLLISFAIATMWRVLFSWLEYETKDCITDGAGYKQIDAVYIDNQSSTIYIIQGKFYKDDVVNAEPLREVLSSWIQIKDLFHLQEGANHKLQVKINEIANAIEDDYEISDPDRADNISTSTNSQSAVKARDLRNNDKSVLALKKAYEQFYTDGYFVTKRGEKVDSVKFNTSHIVNLTDLGKQLIAWHSQRPTISYSETKIFDKYFDQLFHREYSPENVQALNVMFNKLYEKWNKDNPMGLNETLLAMKAYAPYHHLYSISVILCEINKMNDSVPSPSVALKKLTSENLLDNVIDMAGNCLNMAIENASAEAMDNGKMFVPQNWIKSKASLKDIRGAIRNYLTTLKMMPNGKQILENLNNGLSMDKDNFEARWTAD